MAVTWSYEEAFKRNRGLISSEEQETLRRSHVAIVGQGGVGGIHLVTLARLGIGKFTIADGDTFETANFNRQYGATLSSLGRKKVDVMSEILHGINPEAEVKVFAEPLSAENAGDFLKGADLFLDGIDAFELPIRRVLFRKASQNKIFGITAGPIGAGTGWIIFDPKGLSFDDYFGFKENMNLAEQFDVFLRGLCPGGAHRAYMDLSYIDPVKRTGPSLGLACQLAAGVAAGEAIKILLGRGDVLSAPVYRQFDVYTNQLIQGRYEAHKKQ